MPPLHMCVVFPKHLKAHCRWHGTSPSSPICPKSSTFLHNHSAILTSMVIHSNSLMSRNSRHSCLLGHFKNTSPLCCRGPRAHATSPLLYPASRSLVPCTFWAGPSLWCLADDEQLPACNPLPVDGGGTSSTKCLRHCQVVPARVKASAVVSVNC